MRSITLRTALAAAGIAALAAAAQAAVPAGAGSAGPATGDTELSEVTVTGSRVILNGNDAPTPVTVVSVEDMLVTKPTSVFENLADLPMFSGSRGLSGAAVVTGPANANSASLNLRNLGGQRTLVLFDGKRMPPTSADGFADPNMLPQLLLERVDVVTGGASAVYGSDAVTGVVNFIVDRKYTGVKANLQRGLSSYNDDGTFQAGIAGGMNLFGGRGHVEASYEHHSDAGILDREAAKARRQWLKPDWTLQGDGTVAFPWHLQDNVKIATATFGGLIVCPTSGFLPTACVGRPLVGQTFDENGVLTPFQHGATTGLANATLRIGGDGAVVNAASLKSREKLNQLFVRFDYDLSDRLHAFVSVSGTERSLFGYLTNYRNIGQGWALGACNAFLAQQYQTALGCTAANSGTATEPTFRLSKYADTYAPGNTRVTWDNYERNYFAIGGLEGRFGNGYRWEAAVTHSKTVNNVRAPRNNQQANTYAAIDAVVNPANGQIACKVTLTNPGLYPGCVPFNPFGPTAASVEATNYIFGLIEFTAFNKLTGISGSVAGAPFNTWAGPLDMALSGEYRRQSYELTSSSLPTDFANCTGIRFGNCVQGTTLVWLSANAARPPVTQNAAEAALEFNAPLLRDKPLIDALDLNAAARYTRYNSDPGSDPNLIARSINASTWKAGITWDLTKSLTVRLTRSRDMRAPNLFDLYSPVAINPRGLLTDFLLPGAPSISAAVITGGNPNLKPEISHTSTLGVVWRPTADFSASLDGYDITIKDALANINGQNEPVQRACYASGGTSPLCSLQERPFPITNTTAANQITATYTRRINVAVQKTWGIDFETNWKTRLLSHPMSLRTLVTYQPHLIYAQAPLATQDQAGASINNTYGLQPAPVWRATVFAHFALTDALALDIAERYRSNLRWTADPDRPNAVGGVPSVAYTNLNASYNVPMSKGQLSVFLNVQNVFNKDPPAAADPGQQIQPGSATNGYLFGDDVVGRYYNLGARLRF